MTIPLSVTGRGAGPVPVVMAAGVALAQFANRLFDGDGVDGDPF